MKVSSDACVFGGWVAALQEATVEANQKMLDIGAGTGLLSIMLAQKFTQARILGIEIDARTATQATGNALTSPWYDRIEIWCEDIRSLNSRKKFDLIVSNPPFYEGDLQSPNTEKNSAHHDASLRFDELIVSIDRHLRTGGVGYLLLPIKKLDARISALAVAGLFTHRIAILHHAPTHPAIRGMIQVKKVRADEVVEERIDLRKQNDEYTDQVKSMLRDYYLAF